MKHIGKCVNFGECSIAKNGQKIPVIAGEGAVCLECKNPLRLYRATMPLWIKVSGSLGVIALIGGIVTFLGKLFPLPELLQDTPPIMDASTDTNNNQIPTIETPTIEFVHPTDLEQQPTIVPEFEPEPSEITIQMTKLKQEIAELKDKIEQLEKRGEETNNLKDKLAKLENKVKIKDNKDDLDIATFEQRFAELESEVKKKLAKNVPNCLSSVSPAMQKRFQMFFVPAMQEWTIPDYLHIWMKGVAHSKINESAFFMMRREVTMGEFQYYIDTLDAQHKDKLKTALQAEEKSLSKEDPVASVPWWAADGYANWLSEQTGCSLTLPTYNQWIVATIRYAKPTEAFMLDEAQFNEDKPKQRQEPESIIDLLGNLREWSKEQCGERGHYILGEDYKTWRANIVGEPICESSTFNTIGFRLVLKDHNNHHQ